MSVVGEMLGPEFGVLDIDWRRIRLRAARLGIEILECEDAGISYAAAARRPGDWPMLAQTHYGMLDVLQYEVPAEHLDAVLAMLERARALDARGFGQELLLASAHERTAESALIRFFIYEVIRINMWLLSWDSPQLEALGAMVRIDAEAQRIFEMRLRESWTYHDETRPLVVLVAETFQELAEVGRQLISDAAAAGGEHTEYILGLTRATGLARRLGAADAAVLRNEYAARVGEEKLDSTRLAERHPTLLRNAQATDTRRSRLVTAIREERPPRVRKRFVDLTRQVYQHTAGVRR